MLSLKIVRSSPAASAVALRRTALGLALIGLLASQSAFAKTDYVPITFRQDSGTRPFVPVHMNGKPFLMMVHANADFTMMTTHENAASIGVDKAGTFRYGISSPGRVSDLGRSETVLPTLTVGSSTMTDLPLSVFSIPQDPPTDGMLAVQWLHAQRIIIDYARGRLGIPQSRGDSAEEDAALIKAGYVPHKISWDSEHHAYFVMADCNGRRIRLSVGTVAQNVLDLRFATEAGLELGPMIDEGFGPSGSHVPVYSLHTSVMLTLDDQRIPFVRPEVFDASAYRSHPSPTYLDAATLGADFMLDNQAVIDFGTETLFLRRSG